MNRQGLESDVPKSLAGKRGWGAMKIIIVLVCVGVMFLLPAYAEQEIVVTVDQGNPPFMFQQTGEAVGIYPTLMKAIFKRMRVEVAVKTYPWKRALVMGENGDVGIGGIYKTAERLKLYDYSAPLYTERVLLYVRKERVFTFNTFSDLEGKIIGALLGWSYGDAFDQARKAGTVSVYEVPNDKKNFQKLVSGRLDGVLALELTGNLIISQEGYHDRLVALETPVAVNETYLAFAKRSKKKGFLDQFNATLKAMKEDGTYAQVIQAYLEREK